MVFPGQELGLSGTVVPPNRSVPSAGPPFGYDRFVIDSPTFPKPIPSFMSFNSMMPLWRRYQRGVADSVQLHHLYAAINRARDARAALRSANYTYLNLRNGSTQEQIFSV